ncbi:hypothetical protein DSM106972_049130 [Dulcicalothrix desertica PCC 7102]|uniref:Uncharacterized protein n=1 Tax=Dulcicalothrix desertica PCC 7102 TaxID=232991 RepID=A0A3S1CBL7_9CYAN|nr:hypothetical protein [Dulcicalothrix desertica]RUT03999.1 hypothetical protein DSM106972_049130 [Dulcicalothrix desertica PCC 7102]TWH43596.1 hypothetical protein CAL7102_07332 [Dulcicalothrix desertica PCC 7102]
MPQKIYAPNVHLFAFHLKVTNPHNLLWDKCNNILSQKLKIASSLEIEEQEGYRVDLLKDKTDDNVALNFDSQVYLNSTPLPITGFATPLRIQDTYALTLNLRRPEFEYDNNNQIKTKPVDIHFLKLLNPSGCLMPDEIGSSLGQTILLTVWYTPEKQWLPWKSSQNRQQIRDLANNCLKEFIPSNYFCPDFNQEGQLFGSPIFEYGVPSQNKNYSHILIWIFCEPATSEKFVDCYSQFVNLYCYYHKVVTAYHLSRHVYQVVRQDYQNIEPYIDSILQEMPVDKSISQEDLNQCKKHLKDIPQKYLAYSRLIRDLDHYRLTIDINAQNYRREIRDIQNLNPNEDLSLLSRFVEEDCRLFSEQIQSDLGYFQHGAALLEKALTAIQGRIEIEQAESDRATQSLISQKEEADKIRDRNLQTGIAILGFGLGAAQVGISAATYIIPQQQPPKPILFFGSRLHPFTQSLLLSLVFAIIGGFAGWGLSKVFQAIAKPKYKL